jgi:Right handed beta helix region
MKKAQLLICMCVPLSVAFGQPSATGPALSPVVGTVSQAQPVEFSLEIPGGVLFGKFDKQSGPFLIKGSIIVPAGQTLEFGPGCKVYIGGDYSTITVFGQIVVKGTREDPVIFQSAKPRPNPWDWDRIYIRSRNRSTFEHCIVRHSNYGVMVENGSLMMNYCQLDHNSLHGLVVRNSDALILNTSFRGGQVVAVLCDGGGDIQAESLFVNNNITGVAVNDRGSFQLRGGDISGNTNGIVAMKGSSVSIIAADITKNRIGLVSQQPVPKKLSEMNYGNGLDVKMASTEEIDKMLKAPEAVKSVALPTAASTIRTRDDFAPGFSAVRAQHEATTSFIGNVTAGMVYFAPRSTNDTLMQNHYPGEDNPAIGRTDNLQPEMQLFASGKKGETDVNLLLDVYGNDWTGFRRNNTNLIMNYSDQSLVLGDFYENNSETSISGRKMTGMKFDGNFWEMGRGTKRLSVKAAFGQTELPKQVGDHEIDLYNTTVDSGMSVRQQMTYEAGLVFKPTFNSSIGARGLIARDQGYNTFIGGEVVKDPKAPNLLQAQTGCIDGKVDLLEGKLSLNAELDMGRVDTLIDTLASDQDRISKIAWYDPQVPDAISKVFGVIPQGGHYALTLGANSLVDGYKLNLTGSQIAPQYFAAGNPYLEIDRRIVSFTGEKEYSEKLAASLNAEYQRRTMTTEPVDNSTVNLGGKYAFGRNLPEFDCSYMFYYETNSQKQSITRQDTVGVNVIDTLVDSVYHIRDYRNSVGIEMKQQFVNDMDYSLKYQLIKEDDLTKYVNVLDNNKRSGIQHQVTARYGFKVGKQVRNRTTIRLTTKDEVLDSLRGTSYKLSDELKLVLVPRKLSLNLKGEYSNKLDKKAIDTSSVDPTVPRQQQNLRTLFASFETEVKYSMTAKWALTMRGRYEKALDDTPGSRENYTVKIVSFYCTYLF